MQGHAGEVEDHKERGPVYEIKEEKLKVGESYNEVRV